MSDSPMHHCNLCMVCEPICLSLSCLMSCEQGTCDPEPSSLWVSLALSDSLWLSLSLALFCSFWLPLAPSGSLRRSSAHKVLARLNTLWQCCHSLSRPGKCQPQRAYNWNYKKADATVQLPLVEERGQLLGCRGADKACVFNSSPASLIVQIQFIQMRRFIRNYLNSVLLSENRLQV